MTDSAVQRLTCRKKYITYLEAVAVVVAWDILKPLLSKAPVIVFGDNDAATACLIKGYSPKAGLSRISGDFWLRVASCEAAVWIDRVESSSNPADGPSRDDSEFMRTLGAGYTEPVTRYLEQSVDDDPRQWFVQ